MQSLFRTPGKESNAEGRPIGDVPSDDRVCTTWLVLFISLCGMPVACPWIWPDYGDACKVEALHE